ncbi:inovirus Gp2 family protein [Aliivibrio salmonicida]|uniref:inovirus Gp2 family protein n=1 Tax=Aliivibrio salmonicida TaxID=40269 RepID=UPI00406D4D76
MKTKTQTNRNLTITKKDTFNGLNIYKHENGLVINYLDKIYNTIDKAITEYPRTMAVRVDLRMSKSLLFDKSSVIKNFIASLDAQIQADLNRKKRKGIRVRACNIRYIWVKERSTSLSNHYHLVLFFNKDVYYCLGDFKNEDNLSHKIKKAWCNALDLDIDEGSRLVNFSDNGVYWLDNNSRNFKDEFDSLFYRASYLAKLETKKYGDGTRSFGCSQR